MGQYLAISPMDGFDTLKSGPINDAHALECRVDASRLHLALAHPPLEFIKIQPRCRWLMAPDNAALAMDDLLFRLPAVNLELDFLLVLRQQRNTDLLRFAHHDRPRPDRIPQFQNPGLRSPRPCLLNRRSYHLQISHSRQHFLHTVIFYAHLMIFEEELLARKCRAITLLVQIGCIAVQ